MNTNVNYVLFYFPESLWVPQNTSNLAVRPENGEATNGSSTGPGTQASRSDVCPARGPHPPPPRIPNSRQKYPMHRKVLANNSLAPPGRHRKQLQYNKIPMPHRLVDPRENGTTSDGQTNQAYQTGSLKRDGTVNNQTTTPVSNHIGSNTLPNPKTSGAQIKTQSKNPEEPHYCNTFGQNFPLRNLGRLDENEDGLSDDSGTTTSGSYDMENPPDRHRVSSVTRMDTVV